MGSRNSGYTLDGLLEVDETQIGVMDLSEDENRKGIGKKQGRGARQAKVLVMASFNTYNDQHGRPKRTLKNVAMEILGDYTSASLEKVMTKWIDKHARIYTDGFRSYGPIKEKFVNITQTVASGVKAVEELPVVHRVIGNLKNQILGIHHSVSQLHLQNYLDEFCYKLNRTFKLSRLMESIALQSVRFCW